VKVYEPLDPVNICLFGAITQPAHVDGVTNLIEKFRRLRWLIGHAKTSRLKGSSADVIKQLIALMARIILRCATQ
jgi:hypothetical protein